MIADAHDKRRRKREGWGLFEAEAAYADSIFYSAIGDTERCIHALERAVAISPGYAPAVLSLGSVAAQPQGERANASAFSGICGG